VKKEVELSNKLLADSRLVEKQDALNSSTDESPESSEDDLFHLSNACITEALSMIKFVYSIVLDARVTSFGSIIRNAVSRNDPLWHGRFECDRNRYGNHYEFTDHGHQLFRSIFTGTMGSLDCMSLSRGGFLDTLLGLVMSPNHSLCDSSLSVLQAHFGEGIARFTVLIFI
jgi:hypothetical protein